MKLYKLYIVTKDNSYEKIFDTLIDYFVEFTIYESEASFVNTQKSLINIKTYIVEIIAKNKTNIENKIGYVEGELGQQRILVTEQKIKIIN